MIAADQHVRGVDDLDAVPLVAERERRKGLRAGLGIGAELDPQADPVGVDFDRIVVDTEVEFGVPYLSDRKSGYRIRKSIKRCPVNCRAIQVVYVQDQHSRPIISGDVVAAA